MFIILEIHECCAGSMTWRSSMKRREAAAGAWPDTMSGEGKATQKLLQPMKVAAATAKAIIIITLRNKQHSADLLMRGEEFR